MTSRDCVCSIFVVLWLMVGCSPHGGVSHARAQPSDSVQSKMINYGCPTCHVIPGVPGAVGKVGPSLAALSQRSYLAGRLANNPPNLETWLEHPQRIEPGVAMPEMGVTPTDAQQIATYLEQLQ